MKILLVVISFIALAGCANLQTRSSGYVGCPPHAIMITNEKYNFWTTERSWTAECNGQKYYCSSLAGESVQISCAPEKK